MPHGLNSLLEYSLNVVYLVLNFDLQSSGDVKRYNSADDDNFTQVWSTALEHILFFENNAFFLVSIVNDCRW